MSLALAVLSDFGFFINKNKKPFVGRQLHHRDDAMQEHRQLETFAHHQDDEQASCSQLQYLQHRH